MSASVDQLLERDYIAALQHGNIQGMSHQFMKFRKIRQKRTDEVKNLFGFGAQPLVCDPKR